MKKAGLTIIILAADEVEHLKTLLPTTRFAQETIVLLDKTNKEIEQMARNEQALTHIYAVRNDWSAKRNYALTLASQPWVLFVDADERISPDLAEEIAEAIAPNTPFDGYRIKREDVFLGKRLLHGETGHLWLTRLGRKKAGSWVRPVHEIWQIRKTGSLKKPLQHYSHASWPGFLAKIRRYAALEAKHRIDNGQQFSLFELVCYPVLKFGRNFIWLKGFLDGYRGLLMALGMSYHSWLVRWQMWRGYFDKVDTSTRARIWRGLMLLMVPLLWLGQLGRAQITNHVAIYWFEGVMLAQIGLMGSLMIKSLTVRVRSMVMWGGVLVAVAVLSVVWSVAMYGAGYAWGGLYALRLGLYLVWWWQLGAVQSRRWWRLPMKRLLVWVGLGWTILGLLQYIVVPDTRFLFLSGWDEHYYRLIGTIFDPGYLGLLLVLTWWLIVQDYSKDSVVWSSVVLVALLLTYSRSSYLVFLAAYFMYLLVGRGRKYFWWAVGVVLVGVWLLPRPGGEGVRLERTYSIETRVESTQTGLELFKQNPLLGVGFNNYRLALQRQEHPLKLPEHANAPDNSFLYVMATMGTVGILSFLMFNGVLMTTTTLPAWVRSSMWLVLVGSLFNNSWFYPMVMIWMGMAISDGVVGEKA